MPTPFFEVLLEDIGGVQTPFSKPASAPTSGAWCGDISTQEEIAMEDCVSNHLGMIRTGTYNQ